MRAAVLPPVVVPEPQHVEGVGDADDLDFGPGILRGVDSGRQAQADRGDGRQADAAHDHMSDYSPYPLEAAVATAAPAAGGGSGRGLIRSGDAQDMLPRHRHAPGRRRRGDRPRPSTPARGALPVTVPAGYSADAPGAADHPAPHVRQNRRRAGRVHGAQRPRRRVTASSRWRRTAPRPPRRTIRASGTRPPPAATGRASSSTTRPTSWASSTR